MSVGFLNPRTTEETTCWWKPIPIPHPSRWRRDALDPDALARGSPEIIPLVILNLHVGQRSRNRQRVATREGASVPHRHSILIDDEVAVGLESQLTRYLRTARTGLLRSINAVTIRDPTMWQKRDRSYRLAAPSGIGSVRGAVEIDDEVAVVLEVEIHALVEAGEGCVGGSDVEVDVGFPVLLPGAEHGRGTGEEKNGFEKHVSCVVLGGVDDDCNRAA